MSDADRTNLFKLGGFGVVVQKLITDRFLHARYELMKVTRSVQPVQFVPQGDAPFGQHQELRPLGWSPPDSRIFRQI